VTLYFLDGCKCLNCVSFTPTYETVEFNNTLHSPTFSSSQPNNRLLHFHASLPSPQPKKLISTPSTTNFPLTLEACWTWPLKGLLSTKDLTTITWKTRRPSLDLCYLGKVCWKNLLFMHMLVLEILYPNDELCVVVFSYL